MEKKVTVLTPNGRRQNVKVTPNTTLLQILEEACQKHNFESDDYGLKHHNKEVDLTQMFRFSGLPNNCLLEMTPMERKRTTSSVDICVQLEDGSRAQGTFHPNDNLWLVVERLSSTEAANFESPVAIYMRREIIGRERMSTTSLKSLGITEGRAMIRFVNKDPEELKTQANVYIPPTVKETPIEKDPPKASRSNNSTGGGGFAITKDLVQSLKKTSTVQEDSEMKSPEESNTEQQVESEMKPEKPKYDWSTGGGHVLRAESNTVAAKVVTEEVMEVEPEVHIIGERNAILYSLDSIEKHIEELPDSFYDFTVHDLNLVLRDLKKIAAGNEDTPMLTQKLRELEENKTMLNKIAQYKNCIIRVQFPDRYVLQGVFKPIDSMAIVAEFVRQFLLYPDRKFNLFTIPPKSILPLDKTLLELDFVPNALMHFAYEDEDSVSLSPAEQSYLKEKFIERLTTAEGAIFAANKFRLSNRRTPTAQASTSSNTNNNNERSTSQEYESRPPGPSTGAIPKRARNLDE